MLRPLDLPGLEAEPLVSVLITNFNYGHFIGEALDSVIQQGYEHIEVVVCDDGSTDDSCSIVERYAARDSRIHLVRQPNGGQGSAFNSAFAASTGDVLCFLDADDIFSPDKVNRVIDAFQGDDAGLLIHQMMIVDDKGQELQRIPTFTKLESGWMAERILSRGGRWRWMPTSAMCLRRQIADRVFPVPEEPFRVDADLFILELAPLLTKLVSLEEVLALYRLHGSNLYSQRGLNSIAVSRTIRTVSTALREVNKRLESLDLGPIRLDPARNLKLLEQTLLLDSFEGAISRRQLMRRYLHLMRTVFRDDLYSRSQKLWSVVLYGVLIMLPQRLRPPWASTSLGISHLKEVLRRLIQREFRRPRQ